MRINGVMAHTAYAVRSPEVSPLTRFRRSLTPADRRSLWAMGSFIVLLHVAGLGILFGFVTPQHFQLGGDHPVFTVGVGVLAYTFGLRHAFDADHIAAVDNTTRSSSPTPTRAALELARGASRCRSASGSPSGTRRSCSRSPCCSRSA